VVPDFSELSDLAWPLSLAFMAFVVSRAPFMAVVFGLGLTKPDAGPQPLGWLLAGLAGLWGVIYMPAAVTGPRGLAGPPGRDVSAAMEELLRRNCESLSRLRDEVAMMLVVSVGRFSSPEATPLNTSPRRSSPRRKQNPPWASPSDVSVAPF
jgi:hypothetical protein